MIKPQALDIDETISKLDSCSDLSDEGNRDTFRLLVEEFGSWGHPLTIQYLLHYLDDNSDYPEVLFDIVHVIESYTPLVYIQRLLPAIPSMMEQAPQWTKLLHYRIFNHPDFLNMYKERLQFVREECRNSIQTLLLTIKSEDPEFAHQCDLLLYGIRKEEMKRLIKPVDIESLTADLERDFEDGFRKVILRHIGEKVCALGIILNEENLSLHASINTLQHNKESSTNRWDIRQWRDHEGLLNTHDALSLQCGNTDTTHETFLFHVTECCMAALENLSDQGFFPRDCIFVFTSEGAASKAQHIEWAERLNTMDNANSFKQWLLSV